MLTMAHRRYFRVVLMAQVVLTSFIFQGSNQAAASAEYLDRGGQTATLLLQNNRRGATVVTVYAHQVILTVYRGFSESTSYSVRGGLKDGMLTVGIGRFGALSARFVPLDRVWREPPVHGCRGPARISREGYFKGRIKFRGERGYVSLRKKRVPGTLQETRWNCKERHIEERSKVRRLRAGVFGFAARSKDGALFFAALRKERDGKGLYSTFVAGMRERQGRVLIERRGVVVGPSELYAVDALTGAALVRPGNPFQGSGLWQASQSMPKKWSGDLRVSLPGAPPVVLAGEEFVSGPIGKRALRRILTLLKPK